ncbi:hypothetical protein [Gilvimarinus agarilyticus]|uniref:hypothetical protein n=1 Tax=Gilvimarinus agarilyticus TaxID=679259 RepID=UPI0012FCE937|nr:hypothetical protein [Gilvimarinus agarilyticus]
MKTTFLPAVLLALGLTACQTTEVIPPSDAEVEQLAHDIEAAAVTDMTVINRCSALGGPTGSYASAARETWQFNNENLVIDAERLLNSQRKDQVVIDAMPYSLIAIARVHDLSVSAHERLNLAGRSPNGQKTVCERELSRLETQSYATEFDLATLQALGEKAESAPASETSAADILTRWAHWPKPGRSYISLSESAKTQCPQQSRIITLENNWPTERYAVYCDDTPQDLIQCEWGSCEATPNEFPERE